MAKKKLARELATDLLHRSSYKIQMAAVLSSPQGEIFAWGWNHRIQKGSVHAEAHAITRAEPKKLSGATLTVTGQRKNTKKLVLARPCTTQLPNKRNARERTCMGIAQDVGIHTIEYRNQDGSWTVMELQYVRVK